MEVIRLENVNFNTQPISLLRTPFRSHILNHNTYVVGDLHGNFARLILTLIHFNFITMKAPRHGENVLVEILTAYKAYNLSFDEILILLNRLFYVTPDWPKELIFIGDTICDRGLSDFLTLTIFHWMKMNGIRYSVIMGNHELTILRAHAFSKHPQKDKFIDLSDISPLTLQHNSFDYFRLPPAKQRILKTLCQNFFANDMFLFKIIPQSHSQIPILLTHTPINQTLFIKILEQFEGNMHDEFMPAGPAGAGSTTRHNTRWHDIFIDPVLSENFQSSFNAWFRFELSFDLDEESFSESTKEFWKIINNFCFWRITNPPFFVDRISEVAAQVLLPDDTDTASFIATASFDPSLSPPAAAAAGASTTTTAATPPLLTHIFSRTTADTPTHRRHGVHIFGHMAGVYQNREPRHISGEHRLRNSQVCLDTLTGMPGVPIGPVVYACLNQI